MISISKAVLVNIISMIISGKEGESLGKGYARCSLNKSAVRK